MKITENKFYFVDSGNGSKDIFDSFADVLTILKQHSDDDELDKSKIAVAEIDISNQWKTKEIPWQELFFKVLKKRKA